MAADGWTADTDADTHSDSASGKQATSRHKRQASGRPLRQQYLNINSIYYHSFNSQIPYPYPLSLSLSLSTKPQQPFQTVLKLGIQCRRSLRFCHTSNIHTQLATCLRAALGNAKRPGNPTQAPSTHLTMSLSVMNPSTSTPAPSHTPFTSITIPSTASLHVSGPFREPSPAALPPPICHRAGSTGNDLNATDTSSSPPDTFDRICESDGLPALPGLPGLPFGSGIGDCTGVPG